MQQTSQSLREPAVDRDSWEVCDPEKRTDPLPMPYLLVDEVLNEAVLQRVYLGVHDIEKKKKDANYEGAVKELQSQGTIDLEGVSAMCRDEASRLSHLILGDRCGTLYILDVGKKLILSK